MQGSPHKILAANEPVAKIGPCTPFRCLKPEQHRTGRSAVTTILNTSMEQATNPPGTPRFASSTAFVLGIDVGATTLALALVWPTGKLKSKSLRNDESGFEHLMNWLKRHAGSHPVHACMEASGGYEEAAALFLHEQGLAVSVVNPRQIKAYGQAQLRRSKTDRADAALIARYCRQERPPLWTPPAEPLRDLREMTRGLDALKAERDRIGNQHRRKHPHSGGRIVAQALEAVLQSIEDQIAALEARIEAHLEAHPELARERDLLVSIPGVGSVTAAHVLAELGGVSRFGSAREAAAYAGLVPSMHESGTSVKKRPRLSKVGNGRLRKALYFPALTALRCNEAVRRFGDRLTQKGKAKKAVVGAAMRKLLHICYGVLRSGRPFDPSMHLSA